MEGPRAPRAEEFGDIINFLNHSLRQDKAWSIADEYPTAVSAKNLHNIRIITEENKILSHAAIKPTIIKTRRGLFKVGCIGSVITHESARNQGLSQAVLNDCLQAVTDQSCDVAILWTNLYDFYRKLGFELAGTEVNLTIENNFLPTTTKKYRIHEGSNVDPQAILKLYMQHTVCSVRSIDEIEKFLKIPNSRVYTCWDEDNKLAAYCIEGKGADLNGYIHEWGGNVDALLQTFHHVQKHQNRTLHVLIPAHSQNLVAQAQKAGAQKSDGFLGMIKICNHQAFYSKIVRNVRQEFGIQDFVLEKRGNETYFGRGNEIFKTTDDADIVRLIFGPQKASSLCDYGPGLNQLMDQIFPIEFWIWGWESV